MNLMERLHHWYDQISKSEEVPDWFRALILVPSGLLFQGLMYMDRSERVVKICLSALVGGALFLTSRRGWLKFAKSIAVAHLLNFLLNGQPWVLAKNLGLVQTSEEQFSYFIRRMSALGRYNSVKAVLVYGSYVRDGVDSSSDLDVRVVRKPGLLNGILVPLLVARERIRANVKIFPLDIYVLDGLDSLKRLRDDEEPTVLIDKDGWFSESS